MSEALLVNRTRFTSSLQNELFAKLDQLSAETRIPKSRLLDMAVESANKKSRINLQESEKG